SLSRECGNQSISQCNDESKGQNVPLNGLKPPTDQSASATEKHVRASDMFYLERGRQQPMQHQSGQTDHVESEKRGPQPIQQPVQPRRRNPQALQGARRRFASGETLAKWRPI